ncbi:MAG: hypothetical protein ACRC78_00935 [Planktothrix sp.]
MRSLILRTYLSLGDILALTTAVRGLNELGYKVGVDTTSPEVWENNPNVYNGFKKASSQEGVAYFDDGKVIPVIEPCYQEGLNRSYDQHFYFNSGYTENLSKQLNILLPNYQFPELFLSDKEKRKPPKKLPDRYWVINAGGKKDYTTKWWPHAHAEKLVALAKHITFVQIGNSKDAHFPIPGAINLIGQTSPRDLFSIIYHSQGVVSPISAPIHIAAALTRELPSIKPCIVLAGGREPPTMVQYPGQKVLNTIGDFPCCLKQGCWRNRVIPLKVGRGDDELNASLCELPFEVEPNRYYSSCMSSITPQKVLAEIDDYEIRRSNSV